MPEGRFDGRTIALVGAAEPALVDATDGAFASSGGQVHRLDEAGLAALGRIDVCVCFARPGPGTPLLDVAPGDAPVALEAALHQPLRASLAAASRMADGGGGALVIVGSLDLWHAYARRSAAAIAMGGLLGLVRSIAVELSGKGVRANLVSVGPLIPAGSKDPEERPLTERTLLRSPMQRGCEPQEAAAAIRFVAGPDSAFMTGQTLRVDGGWVSLNQAPEGMRFR